MLFYYAKCLSAVCVLYKCATYQISLYGRVIREGQTIPIEDFNWNFWLSQHMYNIMDNLITGLAKTAPNWVTILTYQASQMVICNE